MIKKFLLIPIIFGGTCLSAQALMHFRSYYSQEDLYWIYISGFVGIILILSAYKYK